MSAPGGMALAGYSDPHALAIPMTFESLRLSSRDQPKLEAFISNLFVNDVECLKEEGSFGELPVTCAACLVGWYNDLPRDHGNTNQIVNLVHKAAKESKTWDASITAVRGAPLWLLTLKSWSKRIKDAFESNNPQSYTEHSSLTEQHCGVSHQLSSVLKRMSTVEAAVNKVAQYSLNQQTLAETNNALLENLQTVSEQLAVSLKTQAKLHLQVAKLIVLTSPASAKKGQSQQRTHWCATHDPQAFNTGERISSPAQTSNRLVCYIVVDDEIKESACNTAINLMIK
jgi:hypothetical protein